MARDDYDDYDDYEDEYDDRPRRRRRGRGAPHRGGLILGLGIASFFVCGIVLGLIAWIMGNNDLKEMHAGRMDPEGEGLTNAGRICGMIAFFLNIVGIIIYIILFTVVFSQARRHGAF